MARIDLDKYYTPTKVAIQCIEKTLNTIGAENITEWLEPSAGNGSFSLQIPNCIAYDIEPEHESVIRQDYLKLDLPYKKGRLIIGNPPFGSRMSLAQKFFKKSIKLGDFIAFILPSSQLSNTNSLFEFDLIHSEDLGVVEYSGREVSCCFNIYKRPIDGLNKRRAAKLSTIQIVRQDSKKYLDFDYHLRMCYWGVGAGKLLKEGETYAAMYKIKISPEFRDEVISVLTNINWLEELNCTAMTKIQQFHIIKVLQKYIPNIH